MKLSAVVLTLNEEKNIQNCIKSLRQISDDIWIVDSFSTDKTKKICISENVKFIENKFVNYAQQRNFALNLKGIQHDWIAMFDADEEIGLELALEIQNFLPKQNTDLVMIRRHDFFFNKSIKYSGGYPTWGARLFRKGRVGVKRAVNEQFQVVGETAYLNNTFNHHPFRSGMRHWLERHVKYAQLEAMEFKRERITKSTFEDLFASGKIKRRAALKRLIYSLPLRPIIVFLSFYIFKKGFIDGRAGFYYCLLKFFYECMISMFRIEIKLSKSKIDNK